MGAHDGARSVEVAVEMDRAGEADIGFEVIEQWVDRLVARFDQRLDDRRIAQTDAARLAELRARDLIEVGDQGRDPLLGERPRPRQRHRRSLRFPRPALLVGQEVGELVEELDVRRGPLAAVAGLSGVVEAHRLGPRLDVLLERGRAPRIGKGEGIVAAHVGADGAIEEVPRQIVCQRHIGNIKFVLVELRLRVSRSKPGVARPAPCGPDCLREVGPAQPEKQADLDRVQARRRDRGCFVDCPGSR